MPTSVANIAAKSVAGAAGLTNRLPGQPPAPQAQSEALLPANVGEFERWASLVGGGLLAAYGLTQRGWQSVVLPIVGAGLVLRGATGSCSVYQALGVNTNDQSARRGVAAGHGVKVEEVVTVNKPAQELFAFWRRFDNLPKFMDHLESVTVHDPKRSRWVAKAPLGMSVAWDAEVINEQPGRLIAWQSLPGADVDTAGAVHFDAAPGGRATEVRVTLKYDPPAGKLGALVAKLFGEEPSQQVRADLQRFKQLMEAGEIPAHGGRR